MKTTEVELLLIEENMAEAEKAISIFRRNNLADKLIHLRNSEAANDFIFCTGVFHKRDVNNQPKTIVFSMNTPQKNDIEFLKKVNSDERTKNISLVVFTSENGETTTRRIIDLGILND